MATVTFIYRNGFEKQMSANDAKLLTLLKKGAVLKAPELGALSVADLRELAKDLDLPPKATKAQIIEALEAK